MALDIQVINMTSSYIPYERPPQPLTLWTAIPRGLQSFLIATEQLDAKALNDEALLSLRGVLPPNFGYVMNDANVTITQDQAADWANEMNLNLQNFYRAPEVEAVALNGNWRQEFPNRAQNTEFRVSLLVQPWPAFPMIGAAGTGIEINMEMFNNAATAALAGTVNAFISFWVFDLEQIRKYPINSPQPTHAR